MSLSSDPEKFLPYKRDPETGRRPWAPPGKEGFEHRIGGLEKEDITGNVSYEANNHEKMVKIREEKIKRIANIIPKQKIFGEQEGDLLVIGWGGTYGSLYSAVNNLFSQGEKIGLSQFNYINPLPKNTASILKKYKKIVVCELNSGQFVNYLRMSFQGTIFNQYNKVQGLPFTISELESHFKSLL